jgi:hypothetical protein
LAGPRRSDAEWRALIKELSDLAGNPKETRERRREAQRILDSIQRPVASAYHPDGANHHRPRKVYASDHDEDYDGSIR